MFSWLSTRTQEKVGRYEHDHLIIDTCSVPDGDRDYETAVSSPEYNSGQWVVVEAYNTFEDAKKGHESWVEKMQNNPPPKLVDCGNSYISKVCINAGCDAEYIREEVENG